MTGSSNDKLFGEGRNDKLYCGSGNVDLISRSGQITWIAAKQKIAINCQRINMEYHGKSDIPRGLKAS
jgi:hypothetical protein